MCIPSADGAGVLSSSPAPWFVDCSVLDTVCTGGTALLVLPIKKYNTLNYYTFAHIH